LPVESAAGAGQVSALTWRRNACKARVTVDKHFALGRRIKALTGDLSQNAGSAVREEKQCSTGLARGTWAS
jgi:hypothetical protein